ncbi:MAG TPA: hypothetical protein VG733_20065 [Chthoniobacteraceae bacterium]|nr:hypothetical protein [Chthoniobacteraceae bacterium]
MRLNDKLIRKLCPSCGGEVTLEVRALDRKINCPKCHGTVVIPSGDDQPADVAKIKASSKKSVAKKRNGRHDQPEAGPIAPSAPLGPMTPIAPLAAASVFTMPKLAPAQPPELEELRISIQRRDPGGEASGEVEEIPGFHENEEPASSQRAVVYCICNGVLKRCEGGAACCVKDGFCVYADELGL